MFNFIKREIDKKRLKDRSFVNLFEPYIGDEIVSFDCETTGLDRKKDELITIGAVKIKDNKILSSQKLEITINPNKEISKESIKIHHIRSCDVAFGVSAEEGVRKFIEFAGNRPLLGYFVEFDISMVNRVFKRLSGVSLPNRSIEVSALYYDKKEKLIPQGNIDLSYDKIINDLKLPTLGQHSAINDAIMNALIYIKLNNTKHL
ncbi:MAG: 3'-5' exonuclease [Campylobacterales bacterium]